MVIWAFLVLCAGRMSRRSAVVPFLRFGMLATRLHPLTLGLTVIFGAMEKNTPSFRQILAENFKKYAEFLKFLGVFLGKTRREF